MAKQASVNLTPATGAVAIFDLMTFLVTALGFVVQEASDGSSYEADVPANGNPITGGGSGAGGLANANAWFRIQEPPTGGSREWVFQRDATNNTDWRVKVSALDGFVGGTPDATEVPSAVDEDVMHGSGTDAVPVHAALFEADGTYRWHLVGFDVAEDTVFPWYAFTSETGTGVPRTLIMVEALAAGSFPPLVGTRAAPTTGEPDAAIYVCAHDAAGSDPFIVDDTAGQWQNSSPPGRGWYAMNGSNGETQELVFWQASSIFYSQASADVGAPASVASSDGFGVNPLTGQDQLFPTFFGRPLGLVQNVMGKGMSSHVRISGVDRSYPDTATEGGETWVYTAALGLLLPFDDGVTPLT